MAGLSDDIKNVVGANSNQGLSGISNQVGIFANILIGIIAAVSVFYIISGAFKWMQSGEKEARPMITNAVIGLIVAILSFFIVGSSLFLNTKL